jgi:ubiquinol-cytochrome c reductase cytochrome c1 subunit
VYETYKDHDGNDAKRIVGYEMVQPGKMSPAEYDNAVRDLVNFMVYMGEPAKLSRYRIGVWVLLFLALLFVVSYAMKKEFWKDIH